MDIQGQGKFEGVNGVLCESASNSLLSTSQYTREKDAVVIMSSTEAVGVKIDSTVTSLLNSIKNHSFDKNQILLAAQLNNDNLYELCDTSYIDNPIITPQSQLSHPHHYILFLIIVVVCPVCYSLLKIQIHLLKLRQSMRNRHFLFLTVILVVQPMISLRIMIQSSQQLYPPNQLFNSLTPTI